MAESITEGTLKQFNKRMWMLFEKHFVLLTNHMTEVGDFVEQDEEIATIETDKVGRADDTKVKLLTKLQIDVSVNAPQSGTIKKWLVNEEDTVNVGQDLAMLEPGEGGGGGEQPAQEQPKEPAPSDQPSSSDPQPEKKDDSKKEASPPPEEKPAPSKQEKPSEPSQPSGKPPSPPKQPEKKQEPRKEATQEQPKKDSPFGNRGENRVKMNRMRLRIAERLKQSQNTAASLTTFNEVDMSSLMEFRKRYKDEVLKNTGVKFGFMSAFSKACVLAMKDIPAVNASIEGPGGGDTIVYRDYVDISVAVATEKGLVTPVVRNAESLDMIGIEKAIAELGKKARDNKLTIEDMAGGSFTISNVGVKHSFGAREY